ncbi:MAG: DNA-protecting protein DprA [Frankiales bacterium]|nr:DNA-protecting protein DprA [Frankiales bacterium]
MIAGAVDDGRVLTDFERVALATLMRVAEPGLVGLLRHVAEHGVEQTLADVRRGAQIGDVDLEGMRHRLATASGEADLSAAAAVGARLVGRGEPDWPAQLEDLEWVGRASLGLWVRGSRSLAETCERSIAIVGTRTATDYGAYVAGDLAAGLAERGWTVVSGLAYGIDAAAHRGALAGGGLTVAVLACGVDVPYPKGHRALWEQVTASGLVVTEHPPGSAPQRQRFLVRNRIIAALSAGTVVVEMAPRSGARSTATHAAFLSRHVMCVPGPVTSAMSVGCHQLLRERPETVLVTKADEVIEQCGHVGELAVRETSPPTLRDQLGPAVAKVFEAVPVRRAATSASIARTAGVSVRLTESALAALAAAGLVEAVGGGWAMTTEGRRDRQARRAGVDELALDWW